MIAINLTVNNSSSNSISPTVCNGYTSPGGNSYTTSGTYLDTVPNSLGCDSVITINLTIHSDPTVAISGLDTAYCASDVVINLTGTPAGGTFAGAGVSGNQFDPSMAGVGMHTITYAYTDTNGCIDSTIQNITVSTCTGIEDEQFVEGLNIFPNPNAGEFVLTMTVLEKEDVELKVLNNLGQEIYTERLKNVLGTYEIQFDLSDYPAGTYSVRVQTDKGLSIRQVVVK